MPIGMPRQINQDQTSIPPEIEDTKFLPVTRTGDKLLLADHLSSLFEIVRHQVFQKTMPYLLAYGCTLQSVVRGFSIEKRSVGKTLQPGNVICMKVCHHDLSDRIRVNPTSL